MTQTMTQTVKVWDPAVRVFHWSLAASFALAWLSAEGWETLHLWAGYAAAGLIAFRLVWGFVGTRHARFSDFLRSPAEVRAYLGDMLKGRERRHLGHNPAGGAMILALIAAMGATCLTGWTMTLQGLGEVMEGPHELFANLLLILVIGHLAGVLFSSLSHRENLVKAMVTGRKRAGAE